MLGRTLAYLSIHAFEILPGRTSQAMEALVSVWACAHA